MPSTYTSLKYHIVFSTKNRSALISPSWQDELHAYLGGVMRGLGGIALAVGGVSDHVHILASLKPTTPVADAVRDIKRASTSWARDEKQTPAFAWQEGYAAFTVAPGDLGAIRTYIAAQAHHHKRVSTKDELLALCKEAGIEVDLRYVD
ncbi:MAG: IS200/IS605 family transposase [Fimbriimonadaceae bacterium]